jgi:hypothetical protein
MEESASACKSMHEPLDLAECIAVDLCSRKVEHVILRGILHEKGLSKSFWEASFPSFCWGFAMGKLAKKESSDAGCFGVLVRLSGLFSSPIIGIVGLLSLITLGLKHLEFRSGALSCLSV